MAVVGPAAELAAIEAINDVIDGESTAIVPVAAVVAAVRQRSSLDISDEQLEAIISATATSRYLKVQLVRFGEPQQSQAKPQCGAPGDLINGMSSKSGTTLR
jgi:hypothetical protein